MWLLFCGGEGVFFPKSRLTTLVLGSCTFPSPFNSPHSLFLLPLPFHRAESGTCMPKSSAPLRTCSWMGKIHVSCCSPGVACGSRATSSSEFDRWPPSGSEWMGPPCCDPSCLDIFSWHRSQCLRLFVKLSYETFPTPKLSQICTVTYRLSLWFTL